MLVDDVPAVFLLNPSGIFVVNPEVNGYTPTPSEVEWPGSVSSLMTISKGAAPEGANLPDDAATAEAAVVTEQAPAVEAQTAAATDESASAPAAAPAESLDSDGDGLEDAIEVRARHRSL